jgi:hypothetical protein
MITLAPTVNIETCVDGCPVPPTQFYLIGGYILIACCDKHFNRIGLCSYYAEIKAISREDAIVMAVMRL